MHGVCLVEKMSLQQLAHMNVRGINGPIRSPIGHISQSGSMVASQLHLRTSSRCKAAGTILVDTPRTSAIRPMATDHGVETSVIDGIKHIKLPVDCFEGFGDDLEEVAEQHGITLTPDVADPLQYARYIAVATAYVTRYLPPSVLFDLQTFFLDKDGPSAIYIEGLPVVDHIPPTPEIVHGFIARLPSTELLQVGLAKCVGDPFLTEFTQGLHQTPSLVKYMMREAAVPDSGEVPLLMHQDYAHLPAFIMDGFMLRGVRGDPSGQAQTLMCDNRHLLSQLPEADQKLLRDQKIYVVFSANSEKAGWHVIQGPEDNPEVKLNARQVVEGETPEVLAAYIRCRELALKLSQSVFLKTGDLLILNNRRLTHGRTAFELPADAGDGRWLARVNVKRPGILHGAEDTTPWPNLIVCS